MGIPLKLTFPSAPCVSWGIHMLFYLSRSWVGVASGGSSTKERKPHNTSGRNIDSVLTEDVFTPECLQGTCFLNLAAIGDGMEMIPPLNRPLGRH